MTSQINNNNFIIKRITSKDVDLIDIMGINVALLYSKNFFKKNEEISSFLKIVYNINFLPYVMKSRTLIVARITKELNTKDETEIKEIRRRIIDYLNKDKESTEIKKSSKKKDANEKLKTWLEGI